MRRSVATHRNTPIATCPARHREFPVVPSGLANSTNTIVASGSGTKRSGVIRTRLPVIPDADDHTQCQQISRSVSTLCRVWRPLSENAQARMPFFANTPRIVFPPAFSFFAISVDGLPKAAIESRRTLETIVNLAFSSSNSRIRIKQLLRPPYRNAESALNSSRLRVLYYSRQRVWIFRGHAADRRWSI